MEATIFNKAQQNILRMLSFVKDNETVSDVEDVLKKHFAKKLDSCVDSLIDDGSITIDTIKSWEVESNQTCLNW